MLPDAFVDAHPPEDHDSETWIVHVFRSRPRFTADTFAAPATVSNVIFPTTMSAVSFPYVLDGIKPIVNVKVNGKGPFPYVVDTGGHRIITAQMAQRVGLQGRGAATSTNEGKVDRVGFVSVRERMIGKAIMREEVAKIESYGFAKLERGPRPQKAGWLGREHFERFQVTFDPKRRMMTLRPLAMSRPVPPGTKLPLVFDEDAPLTACHVD